MTPNMLDAHGLMGLSGVIEKMDKCELSRLKHVIFIQLPLFERVDDLVKSTTRLFKRVIGLNKPVNLVQAVTSF